jgi:hypothetical protein
MIGSTLKDERYKFFVATPNNPNRYFFHPEVNAIKNKEKYFKLFGAVSFILFLNSS